MRRHGPPDEIEQRVLEAAIALAVEGGFDAVKQRDLAERAGITLVTLYNRFGGKDLVLTSALQLEGTRLEAALEQDPISGRTPEARVTSFFERATKHFVERPNLGRAIIRAVSSGDPQCTAHLIKYQLRLTQLAAQAFVGRGKNAPYDVDTAQKICTILIMVWFANLVGWSGGVATPEIVVGIVSAAAKYLLHGAPRAATHAHS